MGSSKRVVIAPVSGDSLQRIKEPVALTTPVLSDDGTGPVWIEGDDLGGGGGISSGTSFPGSPSTDDLFHRTDLNGIFFYDGTRWLSIDEKWVTPLSFGDFTMPIAASRAGGTFIFPQLRTVYWDTLYVAFFVLGGASALSGSHKWDVEVHQSGASGTLLATLSINSGSSGVHRSDSASIADATLSTDLALHITAIKTGTPGNLYFWPIATGRLIAT